MFHLHWKMVKMSGRKIYTLIKIDKFTLLNNMIFFHTDQMAL